MGDERFNHAEISDYIPPKPHCREPIRSTTHMKQSYLNNHMTSMNRATMKQNEISKERREKTVKSRKDKTSKDESNDNSDYDEEMTENFNEETKCPLASYSNRTSPENTNKYFLNVNCRVTLPGERLQPSSTKLVPSSTELTTSRYSNIFLLFIGIMLMFLACYIKGEYADVKMQNADVKIQNADVKIQKEPTNDRLALLIKSINDLKVTFYNQESEIWNDITSAIVDVMTREPRTPSIILLFANEKNTMNCLAEALAHVSCSVVGTDTALYLNPQDFGDDPGEMINKLNKLIPTKKVVIIRDVLNINAKAIKALHNLCDRINPLVKDAIYIITMQTENYEPPQKKLAFVEKQINHKLSKSINEDVLMALVTRITDGAIILVQPEPNKNCQLSL